MKIRLKYVLCGLLIGATVLVSCSKDGAEGPIGLQGPQGQQGMEGTQGPQGPQGEIGTANVIYSDWITVQETDWSPSTGTVTRKTAILIAPEITQEHLDTSAILVYVQKVFGTEPNSIALLPMDDNEFEFVLDGIDIGEIIIKARRIDLGTFNNNFVALPFRYVIIPGGTQAKDGTHPDFEKMTYQDVMDFFGIAY